MGSVYILIWCVMLTLTARIAVMSKLRYVCPT